ncbi:hypothetical protein ACFL6U_15560 [Planctomycetota bacterium]
MNEDFSQLEETMRQYSLETPTSALRDKIGKQTRDLWQETFTAPDTLPWRSPVRRLLVSVAAGIAVVFLAEIGCQKLSQPTVSTGSTTVKRMDSDTDSLTDIAPYYSVMFKLPASSSRRIPSAHPRENSRVILRQFLEQSEGGDVSKPEPSSETQGQIFLKPVRRRFS